jgi:two-component system, NtrC family, response regulator AtoC
VTPTILFADADPDATALATRTLADAGFAVRHVVDASGLEDQVGSGSIDVLVADVALPGSSGLGLLGTTARRWPDLPVVLIGQGATGVDSVSAIRAGATGFVEKPLDPAELLLAVRKGVAAAELLADAPPPSVAVPASAGREAGTLMVGDSEPMRDVHGLVRRAAASTATVLIRGESGSGKEVIARRIHEIGPRSHGPLVKVHCAALPEQLLESELFGHEKGAFTGATSRKPGRVEIAEGGTLFLDEIGDISAAIQVKLLRVLQDKEYERVGGTRTLQADVRFIAATHRPLEEMIRRGEFREDLYYRLNVIPIVAPPLRSRPDDIEALALHFARGFGEQYGRPGLHLAREAIALLRRHSWPGNVRQLQNFVERLAVFAETDEIALAGVEAELRGLCGDGAAGTSGPEPSLMSTGLNLDEVLRRAERRALEKALRKADGNKTVAARILGVSRRTLYNKLEEHGLL